MTRRLFESFPVVTPPTEDCPDPVVMWPGWVWWLDSQDGHPRARSGQLEVQAHNFTALLARIRRAEDE